MDKQNTQNLLCKSCKEFVCKERKNYWLKSGETISIKCSSCKNKKDVSNISKFVACDYCANDLGYVCTTCNIVTPASEKYDYYHCGQCNFCVYKTKGTLFSHCKKCDMDMPVDHACYEIDKCLICLEVNFFSISFKFINILNRNGKNIRKKKF